MYVPKGRHFIYPILTILLGFYIRQKYGDGWDVNFIMFALVISSFIQSAYIWQAGLMHQKFQTREDLSSMSENDRLESARERALSLGLTPANPTPQIKVYGEVWRLPPFNKERNFAKTLLEMQEEFGETDMTEEKWVKSGVFTRNEFKAMLGLWEEYGIIGRESDWEHATYVVLNWEGVKLVASGQPIGNRAPSPTV